VEEHTYTHRFALRGSLAPRCAYMQASLAMKSALESLGNEIPEKNCVDLSCALRLS